MTTWTSDSFTASSAAPRVSRKLDDMTSRSRHSAASQQHGSRSAATLFAAGLAIAVVSAGTGGVIALSVGHNVIGTVASAAATVPVANLPDESTEQVAAKVVPSVVQLQTEVGNQVEEGSGIILTAEGMIMTNDHVVATADAGTAGGPRTTVTFADGRSMPFTVVAADPASDIAIVRAQGVSGLTPIALGSSSNLQVGQQVMAVGSPLGLDGTVTTGIISALNRQVSPGNSASQGTPFKAIQTDAPMNPGNSGGALVNMKGQLIGMNSAIATLDTSRGSIGLGFAIPVDQAKRVADALIAG
jgi:putative serine protease PepD